MTATVAPQRSVPILGEPAAALVTIELRDQSGRILPGLIVGDRWFVVGEEGRRYTIVVRNRSDFRLEIVLSVDGLDVIDGRAASFRKRGYIVNPHRKLAVEGFRQTTDAVAAFASVRCANLTPLKNITTLATSASSALPCSTKWVPTRGPTKKCAVA